VARMWGPLGSVVGPGDHAARGLAAGWEAGQSAVDEAPLGLRQYRLSAPVVHRVTAGNSVAFAADQQAAGLGRGGGGRRRAHEREDTSGGTRAAATTSLDAQDPDPA
jgi:hypothetical protein